MLSGQQDIEKQNPFWSMDLYYILPHQRICGCVYV